MISDDELYVVFQPNLLRGNANFVPPGLLPLTHVFRQLDNEPTEIPIEVASFV